MLESTIGPSSSGRNPLARCIPALLALVLLTACQPGQVRQASPATSTSSQEATPAMSSTTTPDGLTITDVKEGTGPAAKAGDTITVNYTGWLQDGTKFDSSLDRQQPFTFTLGQGQVIKGWDEGVAGMKAGGERKLVIPPQLAYGTRGAGGVIPPDATLTFQVDLLGIH